MPKRSVQVTKGNQKPSGVKDANYAKTGVSRYGANGKADKGVTGRRMGGKY